MSPSTYVIVFLYFFFFFNDTATTEIYTLSLHDALPIFVRAPDRATPAGAPSPLLPDARLAPRRGRRVPGDDAARVEGLRPLRAARAARHLAAHHRHERLPHCHLATARA